MVVSMQVGPAAGRLFAAIDHRMHFPLVLQTQLRIGRSWIFNLGNLSAPTIDSIHGVRGRKLGRRPRSLPRADSLAMQNRMYLVPSLVRRVVDPGALHHKNVCAASRQIIHVDFAKSRIDVVRIAQVCKPGDDADEKDHSGYRTQDRTRDPTNHRYRAYDCCSDRERKCGKTRNHQVIDTATFEFCMEGCRGSIAPLPLLHTGEIPPGQLVLDEVALDSIALHARLRRSLGMRSEHEIETIVCVKEIEA